jgi:gas vesicle protein
MAFRKLVFALAAAGLCAGMAFAQDSQSLGDVARQTRQKKQQQENQTQADPAKAAAQAVDPNAKPAPPAKAAHVYTNDEIPEHTGPDLRSGPEHGSSLSPTNYKGGKLSAEQWKAQIRRLKNSIAALQKQIEAVESSIHFAGGNYERHVLYNNRQRQKEQQVENLKSQLEQQQKLLEDMQEEARHQGYGSAVYDP